ncbi:MAG: hypothetical protein LBE56_12865 [Tannerella sp.]|nr:hypothetical protein [Tannerella sp.]
MNSIRGLFNISLTRNGDEIRLHEYNRGIEEQIPVSVRDKFIRKLFNTISVIEEDANFSNSQITSLGNLQRIGGNAYFRNSQVTDLGNLKRIGGDAYFTSSQVTDLGNLQSIEGDAYFRNSQVTDLGNLKRIGRDAYF